MFKKYMGYGFIMGICGVALFSSGCAMFRAKTEDVSVDNMQHMRADYDATDMRKITQEMVDGILQWPTIAANTNPPIMMIAGVQNRTKQYVDTKNLTDRMRTLLLQSGKVQFVNAERRDELLKEQGYQAAHATAATQVAIGKQLGASYMLTGSLTEMSESTPNQVRVSKTQLNYYKLTIEITDLETGLIAWTKEVEFARSLRIPLIGW